MKEKELHEKKISELDFDDKKYVCSYCGKTTVSLAEDFIELPKLKQWAIATVRSIREKRKESYKKLKEISCPSCGQPRPSSLCIVEDTDQ